MLVQIKKGYDGGDNYIKEIKFIRTLCADRYGFTSGLKESKELIDSVYASQQEDKARAKELSDAKNAIAALSHNQKLDLREYLGW